MLRITPVAIEIVRRLQPMILEIKKHDGNHARQLQDASKSTPANIAEGNAHRGNARRHKYEIALGEARETVLWIQLAEALGYATCPDRVMPMLNHVIGVLVKLTR